MKLNLFVTILFLVQILSCSHSEMVNRVNKDLYQQVLDASEGTEVKVAGYLDGKGACANIANSDSETEMCETTIFRRCKFAYVPLKLPICSDTTTSNCVEFDKSKPWGSASALVNFHDANSKLIPQTSGVWVTAKVFKKDGGQKYVGDVSSIEVIPGTKDPVNSPCSERDVID